MPEKLHRRRIWPVSRPSGLTLIEVLVALALFGFLALLGTRMISQMTRQGSAAERRLEEFNELASAMRLFERDFQKAYSSAIRGRLIPSVLTLNEDDQGLQVRLGSVEWRWEKGAALTRAQSSGLPPVALISHLDTLQIEFRYLVEVKDKDLVGQLPSAAVLRFSDAQGSRVLEKWVMAHEVGL
jgi:prepilin-type N-terminal cleavage/methylation domain-containing protein